MSAELADQVIRVRRTALINPNTAPKLYRVNDPSGPGAGAPPPGVGGAGVAPFTPNFRPDGFIYPRASDQKFDVTVRQAEIPAATTVEQVLWRIEDRIKGGWIRGLGYGFNNPHGEFIVRTFLLLNDAPPSDYLFRTVDSVLGTFEGSFPPFVIGTVFDPTSVFIRVPAQSKISVRYVNASPTEFFSASIRLKGWFFPD